MELRLNIQAILFEYFVYFLVNLEGILTTKANY
jgi:hypothetical protein